MKWRTSIEALSYPFSLNLKDKISFLGSCFAEHIGNKMRDHKFDCVINPVGITYNPASLEAQIDYALGNTELKQSDLLYNDEQFVHLDFHGNMGHHQTETCYQQIDQGLHILQEALITSSVIFISLGSAIAYTFNSNQKIVANCHKLPSQMFVKNTLNVLDILTSLGSIISLIKKLNPHCQIMFTVSPVRHSRHGLIANSRSKANLISAVHTIADSSDNVYYFPSYEIMVDELRDYRFYADDLVHPSSAAVEYIWSVFKDQLLTTEAKQDVASIASIVSLYNHKIMASDPDIKKSYLQNLLSKINTHKFSKSFAAEKKDIEDQLKTL